jgi:GNAT superfamily N-acetyltransferase
MGGMQIRPARGEEAAAITALGLRSKAHWGYDEAFMARCASELRWDDDDLRTMLVHVAERDGALLGFCAVNPAAAPPELDALFVEPDAMGAGVGRALLAQARAAAAAQGIAELAIDADPQAEPFYLREGARRVGEVRSASTGRVLPRLVIATA